MKSITSLAVTPGESLPVSSKRIDSGTTMNVKPAFTSAAYSVAPTPYASAPTEPPMQVCESVAWMKSPGSMIFSRAIVWQMPGEMPSTAEKSCTPVFC